MTLALAGEPRGPQTKKGYLEAAAEAVHPLALAVDPHVGIQRLVKQELTTHGFQVITADCAEEALSLAREQRPDLILIEAVLPDMRGLDLMQKLRERSGVPVIFVSASGSQPDKVRALEMGADDYVVKPFDPDELASRMRAVLRRSLGGRQIERTLKFDGLEIDLNRRLVTRSGDTVRLTRSEWLLLEHLAANSGRVMLNEELLTKVWGPEYRDDIQYLRVWISRLRHKLEPQISDWTIIRTIKGIGYMLDASAAREPAGA